VIDPVSLTIAVGAVVVSVFIYWETRSLRRLTQVMVESLAFIAKGRRSSRGAVRPRKQLPATTPQAMTPRLTAPPSQNQPNPAPRQATAAEATRAFLTQQREERKRLELQLRQQREQWKRQKDVAKAIGWVLDRMGSDEDEEYED
jgi:hypothetical protein